MISKRIFDLFLVIPGILILTPLMLLIAIAVKLDDSGPVLFSQTRVGLNGKRFKILKFRTMIVNAEKYGDKITAGIDNRVTKPGKWLRQSKLDELPQLFNVLKGEMSLVGPRPEVPEYLDYYPDDVREKVLSVPPGITDIASIEFKDENSLLLNAKEPVQKYLNEILPVKLGYNLQYIQQRSVWFDLKLIFKTILAIIR